MLFSERMKRLRRGRGFNQNELAKKLEVSVDTVRRWEWGDRFPDVKELCLMAKVLNTTVSYLTGETDDEFPNQKVGNEEDTSFIERLVKSTSMIVYDTGKERMLIPATKEGFDFIERLRSGRKSEDVTAEKEE